LNCRVPTVAFHTAWIAILLAAAWHRFSLPPWPLAEGDSGAILNPPISLLREHGFQLVSAQSFLYPGLLSVVLGVFKDFRAITILSHLLGLGAGMLLLASWRTAGVLLPERRISPILYDAAGLAMFAIALFALAPVQMEYTIRPDSICPFFAALSIYCMARFLRSRTRAYAVKREWIAWGAAALFVGFLLPALKPSFWMSGMLSTIPVWFALFDHQERWAHRALMAGPALAAACFLLILPGRHFSRMDPNSSSFFPESVFSIHALMIREQIAADAKERSAIPYSREDLESTLRLLDAGIQASRAANPRKFSSLGYDADGLLHTGIFFPKMDALHGSEWALQFYRYYFRRTWERQPRAMAVKVITQLRAFYNFDCPAYRQRKIDLRESYRYSIINLNDPYVQGFMGQWPPAERLLQAEAMEAARAPEIRTPPFFDWTLAALAATYFPVFVLFLAALPWALSDEGRRARYGRFIALLAIAYGYNAGNNLGISIFHTLEVTRYSHVQFATTLFSQMLGLIFLREVAAEIVARNSLTPKPPL